MTSRGTFTVSLEHKGAVTLRDSDYLAQGGEGTIYKSGDTIIKLYNDADKMQRDDMASKIKLLSPLSKLANIVAPQGIVSEKSKPVGFWMPFAKGEPMARYFTNDHRQRAGFKDAHAVSVAQIMYETNSFVHQHKALMVDANELNWLIGGKKNTPIPIVIDVDSWSIGKWPASVIMPSIRDWHTKDFNELTDWFAWGIVTFQLFTGIHPYKGKHTHYKPGDLQKRMQDNVSVFNDGIRLPAAVRDFSCIPGPLRDWYQVVFNTVGRSIPPSPLLTGAPAKAAVTMRATITATASALIFEKLFSRPGNDVQHVWQNGAAQLADGQIVDLSTGRDIVKTALGGQIVKVGDGWLMAAIDKYLFYIDKDGVTDVLSTPFGFNSIFVANKTIYAITDREMLELELYNADTKPVITASKRWQILPNSTQFFENVAVMDALDAVFVLLPNDSGMHQMRVKHLDNAKIVSAKANGRFAAFVVLQKDGSYKKIELTFDKTYTSYQAWEGGTDTAELNMAIMPRGVVATIVDDYELAIVVPTTGAVNKLASKDITTVLKLANWGEKLVYIRDGAVWQMRM